MKKIIKQLQNLDKVKVQYIFLELLKSHSIDFDDLYLSYIEYLKIDSKKKSKILAGLSSSLIHYWHSKKDKTEEEKFFKAKSAYHLLASGMFSRALIEKELQKAVKDYGYKEDEYGNPLKQIKVG